MKKLALILVLFIFCANIFSAENFLLKIEEDSFTLEQFLEDFKFFLKTQQPESEVEATFKKVDMRKQYFYSNYLIRKIINRFAQKDFLKNKPKLKEAFNRFLHLNAVSNFVQYYKVGRFMKEPTEAQLKEMHKQMLERNMIKAEFRNQPFEKLKNMVTDFYTRQQKQVLMMQFISKVQQNNRIIYNDDLEQNLIQKYLDDKFTLAQMQTEGAKLWMLKFNESVITMLQMEQDLQKFMLVNYTAADRKKYASDKTYRKQLRSVFVENFTNLYLLNFYAAKQKFEQKPEFKRMIDFFYDVQFAQTFVAQQFSKKAVEPTAEEIKIFYNKHKASLFKTVTIEQAKEYIKNRIKYEQLQTYQRSLYERLKNRYRFKVNDNQIN